MIYVMIILDLLIIVIAFLLFAIWRAILGSTATNLNVLKVMQSFVVAANKANEVTRQYVKQIADMVKKLDGINKTLGNEE